VAKNNPQFIYFLRCRRKEEEAVYFCNTQGYNRTISKHGHVQHNNIAHKHGKLQTVSKSECAKDLIKWLL